jgi:hypothetical protein
MDPTEALAAIARYLTGLPGLTGGAHYPVPGADPPTPFALVLWGPTPVLQGDERTWLMTVYVDVLTGLTNESEFDLAEVDPLLVRAVDRFSPANPEAYHLATGDRFVEFCEAVQVDPEPSRRAGYYAPRITFQVKLRRFPDPAWF